MAFNFLSTFAARNSCRPSVFQQPFSGYSGIIARAPAFARHHSFKAPAFQAKSLRLYEKPSKWLLPWLITGATVAGVGLGLSSSYRAPLYCDAPGSPNSNVAPGGPSSNDLPPPQGHDGLPPPPQSSVSLYELSFGTVAGICAGVFVKKGAKMAAWFLGGVFVLIQYLNSASIVRVDWSRAAKKFENLFYTHDTSGVKRPPTVASLWTWLVDFLTADFQPRATFLAGFVLGLRIG